MKIQLDDGVIRLEDDRPVLRTRYVLGQPVAYGEAGLTRVDNGWSVIGLEATFPSKWAAFVEAACQSFPQYCGEIGERVDDPNA